MQKYSVAPLYHKIRQISTLFSMRRHRRGGVAEQVRRHEIESVLKTFSKILNKGENIMSKTKTLTKREEINREIEASNQRLRQIKARIVKLQNWLDDEMANSIPLTLTDMIQDILARKAKEGKIGSLTNTIQSERRLKTLDEHISQSGNYKGYRSYEAQYEKLYAQYV